MQEIKPMAQSGKNLSRLTPKQWQQIVNQQHESGLSQKAFCQSREISLSTFTNWKRKLRQEPEANAIDCQSEQQPDWVEFQMDALSVPPDNSWHMELELPGGVVLRMRR